MHRTAGPDRVALMWTLLSGGEFEIGSCQRARPMRTSASVLRFCFISIDSPILEDLGQHALIHFQQADGSRVGGHVQGAGRGGGV